VRLRRSKADALVECDLQRIVEQKHQYEEYKRPMLLPRYGKLIGLEIEAFVE
jgi:hypothetical protein